MRTVFLFLDLIHLLPLFAHCFILGGIVFVLIAGGGLPPTELRQEQLVLLGILWTLPSVFLLGATSALACYQLLGPDTDPDKRRGWIAALCLSLGSLAPLHWAMRGRTQVSKHLCRRPETASRTRPMRPARPAPRGTIPACYRIPAAGTGAPTRVLRDCAR